MSTTTQSKFTTAMQRLADERDLELVVDHAYANTGTYSFQKPDRFDALLQFPFTFHHGYSSFTSAPDHPLGPGPKGGPWSYVQGAEHDLLIGRVTEVLDTRLEGDGG